MEATAVQHPMSWEDFLTWEEAREGRFEYIQGEVIDVTGTTDRHNTVAGNLYLWLRGQLRGTPCRTFMSDVQVRVEAADAAFYPDVVVTCDPADAQQRRVKHAPSLIAEILSESTAGYDTGRKFHCYRRLESLREYLLIDPDRCCVEVFRRGGDGHWLVETYAEGETVPLPGIGVELPVATLYEDLP